MQSSLMKDSGDTSANSFISFGACQYWRNPPGSNVQQSSISRNLNFNMGLLQQRCQNTKQLSFQVQDQDTSSTQSTGQSYPEAASLRGSGTFGDNRILAQSGSKELSAMSAGTNMNSASSTGVQDLVSPTSQVEYSQSVAHFPFPFAEPFFPGLLSAAYMPQTPVPHPQMTGIAAGRVPLPLDFTQDEPIYVNAKQYHAILRRRQLRAKLEAQNKVVKTRKPYLHESRHIHALKRARGAGGRFLNKKVQESQPSPCNGRNVSALAQLQNRSTSASEVHHPDNYKDSGSTTSCSDVTSASNCDDMFQQAEFKFSVNPQNMQDCSANIGGSRNQHGLSTFQ